MNHKLSIGLIFVLGLILLMPGIASADKDSVVVYYFHRTARCPSCLRLEELTREAITSGFEKNFGNGKIRFISINLDEADHEHFVNDYGLSVQSVVVSELENGKEKQWKRLDQVWDFLHDELHLVEYIQKEIHIYLKE